MVGSISELENTWDGMIRYIDGQLTHLAEFQAKTEGELKLTEEGKQSSETSRDNLKKIVDERKKQIESGQKQLLELDKKRNDMQNDLHVWRIELAEANKAITIIEDEFIDGEADIELKAEQIRSVKDRIKMLVRERETLVHNFKTDYFNSFKIYKHHFKKEWNQAVRKDRELARFNTMRDKFRQMCHEDALMNTLWRQRQEWQVLLKSTEDETVKSRLLMEISIIDQTFEERLPGIRSTHRPADNQIFSAKMNIVRFGDSFGLLLPFDKHEIPTLLGTGSDKAQSIAKLRDAIIELSNTDLENIQYAEISHQFFLQIDPFKAGENSELSFDLPHGVHVEIPIAQFTISNLFNQGESEKPKWSSFARLLGIKNGTSEIANDGKLEASKNGKITTESPQSAPSNEDIDLILSASK